MPKKSKTILLYVFSVVAGGIIATILKNILENQVHKKTLFKSIIIGVIGATVGAIITLCIRYIVNKGLNKKSNELLNKQITQEPHKGILKKKSKYKSEELAEKLNRQEDRVVSFQIIRKKSNAVTSLLEALGLRKQTKILQIKFPPTISQEMQERFIERAFNVLREDIEYGADGICRINFPEILYTFSFKSHYPQERLLESIGFDVKFPAKGDVGDDERFDVMNSPILLAVPVYVFDKEMEDIDEADHVARKQWARTDVSNANASLQETQDNPEEKSATKVRFAESVKVRTIPRIDDSTPEQEMSEEFSGFIPEDTSETLKEEPAEKRKLLTISAKQSQGQQGTLNIESVNAADDERKKKTK